MGVPVHLSEHVEVDLDEFEALRLCDLEGKQQAEAGRLMGVSRGTVQRLVVRARAKVVDALLNQKIIVLLDGYASGTERSEDEPTNDENGNHRLSE